MRPLYTAFYTPPVARGGADYSREVARLRCSLDLYGLEHDIREYSDRGGWQENAAITPTHIRTMQRAYPSRAIVQVDADALFRGYPWLFDEFEAKGVDIAVHYRRGHEMLNGTIWLGPTEGARQVIQRYEELVIGAGNNCHNEQRMLQVAIEEMSDVLRLEKLPAGYCCIEMDIMKGDLKPGEQIIVEHLQASRASNCPGTEAHATRNKRIEEIDGYAMPKTTAIHERKSA